MVHLDDAAVGDTSGNIKAPDVSRALQEHAQSNTGRESMRGLQIAIQEGWLNQRGRELCSFTHDRYLHAAHDLARNEWPVSTMSYRVSSLVMVCWHDV